MTQMTFGKHPIYDKWEAKQRRCSYDMLENKKDIGYLTNTGYLRITV